MYNLGGNAKRRKQKKCVGGGGGIRMAEGTIFTQIVKSVFPYQYQKKT